MSQDQVWNPFFRYCSAIDFLTFVPEEKRISLSTSSGISAIPTPLQGKYQKYLKGFKAISVREHRAVKIIKDLTNQNVELLIDPTLNLSKEEWLAIDKL